MSEAAEDADDPWLQNKLPFGCVIELCVNKCLVLKLDIV